MPILAAIISLTAVRDSYPDLSPDAHSLLFSSNRSGRQAIWVAKADGSEPRILFDRPGLGRDPATPRWSPDGMRIVFAMRPGGSTDENESEIYLMSADGSHATQLTRAAGDDSHPHWSRDGKRIFFNSARATPDPKAEWSRQWIDIYSMAQNGSDVRRHTDCQSVCTYPVPSPDGFWIAHRRVIDAPGLTWELKSSPRNSEVYVTRMDGSASINISNSPAYDGWPIWSPDGSWIAFASNRDRTPYASQIYRVNPDGNGLRPLTTGAVSRAQPSFSPDGRRLLFYESQEGPDSEFGHIARIDIDRAGAK